MEKLGEDVLGAVLKRVSDSRDRKSCSEVCKLWAMAEGRTRPSLRVLEPESLRAFMPRFPNLMTFEMGTRTSDSDLEFVAETCPNIRTLDLSLPRGRMVFEEFEGVGLDGVGDGGLCAIAIGCQHLTNVSLRRRKGMGDAGVIAMAKSARNLAVLDLSWCKKITDQALEAMGATNALTVLYLRGCSLVTDRGLASLATGSLSRMLKKLDLAECDQITDHGVCLLQQMSCLQELNLADCGPRVTDAAGVALSGICTLRRLDLSWLISLTDTTLVAVARDCKSLVDINVTGCELITGAGIRSFADHGSLEVLVLASCYNVSTCDVEEMVSECQSLQCIGLDRVLRGWMSSSMQQRLSRLCRVDWL